MLKDDRSLLKEDDALLENVRVVLISGVLKKPSGEGFFYWLRKKMFWTVEDIF